MSWLALGLLAAGSYGLKVLGVFALEGQLGQKLRPLTSLLPAALFAALVVVQTLGDGRSLVLDARVPGVIAGTVAVWVRAPFVVVVIVATVTTACARAIAGT